MAEKHFVQGLIAEAIKHAFAHIKEKMGDGEWIRSEQKRFWQEYEWNGSTETGWYSTYSINWAEVEEEMDRWIEERFGEQR